MWVILGSTRTAVKKEYTKYLEKGMAIHSSILAWRIPWTEEPGRLVPRITESDMTERLTPQTSTGCNLKYSQKRVGSGHKGVE